MKKRIQSKLNNREQNDINLLLHFYKNVFCNRLTGFTVIILLSLFSSALEVLTIGFIFPFIGMLAGTDPNFESLIFIQKLILTFNNDFDFSDFKTISILFVGLIFVSSSVKVILSYVQSHYCQGIGRKLAATIFRQALDEPFEKQQNARPEVIISSILAKIDTVVNASITPLLSIISAAIISISILTLLFSQMPIASLGLFLAILAIYGTFIGFSKKRIRAYGSLVQINQTSVSRVLNDYFTNLRAILVDDLSSLFINKFEKSNSLIRVSLAKIQFLSAVPKHTIEGAGIALIITITALFHNDGSNGIEILSLIGFLAMAGQRLLPQANLIYSSWAGISSSLASVREITYLFGGNKENEYLDQKDIKFNQTIELRNISFRYDNTSNYALNNLSIKIKKGEFIAITGKTGAGKSTMLDILLGLLSPCSGNVLVDGQPLGREHMKSWREKISYAEQHPLLINDTVVNNICFNSPDQPPDQKRIEAALRVCSIWEEVSDDFPNGIDTHLGDKGNAISGGQRQRLGLGRAIYKNGEIFILDEPTAALDRETEGDIIRKLKYQLAGKTVIVVTHSSGVLNHCDRIVNIDAR